MKHILSFKCKKCNKELYYIEPPKSSMVAAIVGGKNFIYYKGEYICLDCWNNKKEVRHSSHD